MKSFIQKVKETIEITTEEISFFNYYKHWLLFCLLLALFFLVRFHRKRKQKRSTKVFKDDLSIENKNPNAVKKIINKTETEKKNTSVKTVKKKITEAPKINKSITEEIEIKEKSIQLEDIIDVSTPVKKKKRKQTKAPKIVKKPVFKEIISKEETNISKIKAIGYHPTGVFEQGEKYNYPLVLMPKPKTKIKFPRKGCSNKTGYTEELFFEYMQNPFAKDFQLYNDRHIPSKKGHRPYEPDIVLISEKKGKNIFIDIEIDEPYEGFGRTPTHEVGKDIIRNEFFTNRGWVVIRFSERQIHQDPKECCFHIAKVIAALDSEYEIPFHITLYGTLEQDKSWDSLQSKKWAKERYREKYLGIDDFGARPNIISNYIIDVSENDSLIESKIEETFKIPKREEIQGPLGKNIHDRDNRLRFDPIEHRYYIDGNPDTISASQLIAKFFPEFDSEYWSRKKAIERLNTNNEEITDKNILRMQKIIQEEWRKKGEDAANLGTHLHEEIENYYNGLSYNDKLPEFQHFLKFKSKYSTMKPYRSEWRVFDEEYLIAGTIDMVYQKDGNELYMFDWKRSEKVVDARGNPRLPSYDYASGELSHLSDNSYNKYAIQQNIYKYIIEKKYNKKITSMNLLILHPNYDTYHLIKLPDLTKEVEHIFKNSKYYR